MESPVTAGVKGKKADEPCFPVEGTFSEKFSVAADLLKTSETKKTIKSEKEPDPILFERLKSLRKEIALKKNLPPYIIFSDTSLKEIATRFPRSSEEFHSITGVGEYKLRKYGEVFLKEIENYCRDYGLLPPEKSKASCKDPDLNKDTDITKATSKKIAKSEKNLEAEIKIAGAKMPDLESGTINSLEACNLPTKKARYLNTSIQDWSEENSSASGEINLAEISPESGNVEVLKTEPFGSRSSETDSLQRTFSLFTKGLGIDEIAEIQGLSTKTVFSQLEQLALSGKIRSIGGLFPPEKQKQLNASLETLEIKLNFLLQASFGENYQKEEIKFVKALLLSRICFSPSKDDE